MFNRLIKTIMPKAKKATKKVAKRTKKETFIVERIGKMPEVFTCKEEAEAFSKSVPGSNVKIK